MIDAALIGVLAGVLAGMLGIGGGALFVPALTLFAGLGQVDAEATSLLAIIPVAAVGAWRQHQYDNVRVTDGVLLGVLASVGAVGGVVAANAVPERALELGFAALQLFIAQSLVRRALAMRPEADSPTSAPQAS